MTLFKKGFNDYIKLALSLRQAFGHLPVRRQATKAVLEAFSKATPARRTARMLEAKSLRAPFGGFKPSTFSIKGLERSPFPPGHPALQALGKPLQIPRSIGKQLGQRHFGGAELGRTVPSGVRMGA